MDKGADLANAVSEMKLQKKATKVRMDWDPENYKAVVDESVLNINFNPDIFQKQAFYFLSKGESVFVSAHTSSGKTLVAEYAIGLSIKNNSRVIYTSPIKALSNQKYYDFKHKFPDVGLITGDVQVNPDARCLIMTTEILRNLVYKNSDILRDTEFVIFDEVHYINDPDRGVVWEECIILLPKHITFVMLSATIPNSMEFAEWVGRTKDRCVYVISTNKRAVPLEFAVYCDADVFSIDDNKPKNCQPVATNFKNPLLPFSKKTKISNKFRVNDLGNFVNNKRLVPAIFFTFSKRICEEYGKSLQLLDLTTPAEKKSINKFLEEAMLHLREEDRNLPQIRSMKEQVYCGIAIHHGALLPFVKECVEILFSENLIKILVATETFAMGVNMPAKCCAFLGLTKIDGPSFRYLNTGEFVQMSGRAGRRGMDKVGTVLIADQKSPSISIIKNIINGIPNNLNSQFKLSFSLILMALRSNVEVEKLMRNSFREHDVQRLFHADMIRLSKLENIPLLKCEKCEDYMSDLQTMEYILQEMPYVIKKNVKKGDTILLKNNSFAKVESICSTDLIVTPTYVTINGKFFTKKIDDQIQAKYAKNTAKNTFQYPLIYFSDCKKKIVSFDECAFIIRDGSITFNFDETDIQRVSLLLKLKSCTESIFNSNFFECPLSFDHYFEALESKKILDSIDYIKSKYSAHSLQHMKEYSARVQFLNKHTYISGGITLKGRVAAEIRTVNDVLVTELIFNNELEDWSSKEIISLFSTMINEEAIEDYEISEDLQKKADVLKEYFERLSNDLDSFGIPPFEPLNFSSVQAVSDWCEGIGLGNIVAKHKVAEGSFVRLLLRLDECCREMANVANLIGNEKLIEKFSSASEVIKRDIVFMPSLYI